MSETHSRPVAGGRGHWSTERLWELAAGLPVKPVPIASIAELDQDCWFGGRPATCRAVAEHARRIMDADLAYPVILSSDGRLMDGGHRLAKAWLDGHDHVLAVRFTVDPAPDYVTLDADPGGAPG